jgi:hypothetical protein
MTRFGQEFARSPVACTLARGATTVLPQASTGTDLWCFLIAGRDPEEGLIHTQLPEHATKVLCAPAEENRSKTLFAFADRNYWISNGLCRFAFRDFFSPTPCFGGCLLCFDCRNRFRLAVKESDCHEPVQSESSVLG